MVKHRIRLTNIEKSYNYINTTVVENMEDELLGDIHDVIKNLQELAEKYKDYDTLRMELEYGSYSDSGKIWVSLVGTNKESENTYIKRIAKLKKQKLATIKKREAMEKSLYKQLKKRYEAK